MTATILVLNAGSSSVKFQLFAVEGGAVELRGKGLFEAR
jgi:acetate kinase